MSTKCSLFLTEDNEHWYHDVSDGNFNIEIDKKNIISDYTKQNNGDVVLEIKEGSQLWKCLMHMMEYRRQFDNITD